MRLIRQPHYDLSQRPFLVIWEVTQACDLVCRHCRAEAQPEHDPEALTYEEGCALMEQIEAFGRPSPLFILTGGDPFKRADVFDLVAQATERGLAVAVSPSGTPLLNRANLQRLKEAGARAISLSLDGSTPEIHDAFRQVGGSFAYTLAGWEAAHQVGLKVQVNTTVTRHNLDDLARIFALVRDKGAMTWSVFFLVPTGRGQAEDEISPLDYEAVMHFLYDASKYLGVKTTEGHHYKRVVLQRWALEARGVPAETCLPLNETYWRLREELGALLPEAERPSPPGRIRRAPLHVNSADGFVFISRRGEVFPSGYLPLSAGNVRQTPLTVIYRHSELFQALRDKGRLKGRCGRCEFRNVCGGSRSRAYALTGDVLAEEPYCVYEPGSFPYLDDLREWLA